MSPSEYPDLTPAWGGDFPQSRVRLATQYETLMLPFNNSAPPPSLSPNILLDPKPDCDRWKEYIAGQRRVSTHDTQGAGVTASMARIANCGGSQWVPPLDIKNWNSLKNTMHVTIRM